MQWNSQFGWTKPYMFVELFSGCGSASRDVSFASAGRNLDTVWRSSTCVMESKQGLLAPMTQASRRAFCGELTRGSLQGALGWYTHACGQHKRVELTHACTCLCVFDSHFDRMSQNRFCLYSDRSGVPAIRSALFAMLQLLGYMRARELRSLINPERHRRTNCGIIKLDGRSAWGQ